MEKKKQKTLSVFFSVTMKTSLKRKKSLTKKMAGRLDSIDASQILLSVSRSIDVCSKIVCS